MDSNDESVILTTPIRTVSRGGMYSTTRSKLLTCQMVFRIAPRYNRIDLTQFVFDSSIEGRVNRLHPLAKRRLFKVPFPHKQLINHCCKPTIEESSRSCSAH